MTRRSHQLTGKVQRQPQAAVGKIEVELFEFPVGNAVLAPAPCYAGKRACDIFWDAERFADFTDRAARAVARHSRGQGGPRPAIGIVNPLDDFLAPLVLEV